MALEADFPYEIVQYLIIVVLMVFLTFQILWMVRKSSNWIWGIPFLVIGVHALIFYITIFLRNYGCIVLDNPNFFTNWSTVLRIHTYSTFAVMVVEKYFSRECSSDCPTKCPYFIEQKNFDPSADFPNIPARIVEERDG